LDSERLFAEWLQKQAEAEADNVAAWGGEEYREAITLARECERLLEEKLYLSARESCEVALHRLEELTASKGQRLEAALSAGLQALEQGDQEEAGTQFQRAFAMDASDKRIAAGLRRAEQLPAVLRYLQDGQTMETAGDLNGALLAFTKASSLDPDYLPAKEAAERVRTFLSNQEFQQAMSNALQALSQGRLDAAGTNLQKAEKLRPGDPAVGDFKLRLAQDQLSEKLTRLRLDAERFEDAENWAGALRNCQEALTIDSHAVFANICKDRASSRLNLDQRLKAILAKPERMFEDGPLKEARQALIQASAVSPRGPLISAQIDQLARLITQAEAEEEVVLLSDGLTDVVIYHVGRLGYFQEKTLVLRTGDYTVTGSRDGFRDVRMILKVRPASGKIKLTVRCEEPI
jgi:tetratricopeptide (TPR) repeat protein